MLHTAYIYITVAFRNVKPSSGHLHDGHGDIRKYEFMSQILLNPGLNLHLPELLVLYFLLATLILTFPWDH